MFRGCSKLRIPWLIARAQYSNLLRGSDTSRLIDKLFFRRPKPVALDHSSVWNISTTTKYLASDLINTPKHVNVSDTEHAAVGESYVQYYISKHNLLSSKLKYEEVIDSVISTCSARISKQASMIDALAYIGSATIHDPHVIDSLFSSNVSFTQDKFILRFNSKVPFVYDIIDEEVLYAQSEDIYEFPSLPPSLEFNPLFLVDPLHVSPFCQLVYNQECDSEVREKLHALYEFGYASTNFHLRLLDQTIGEDTIKAVLTNSLINRIVKMPRAQEYLTSMMEHDSVRHAVFYQYIGLVSMNGFPIEWLQRICEEKKSGSFSLPMNISTAHPALKDIHQEFGRKMVQYVLETLKSMDLERVLELNGQRDYIALSATAFSSSPEDLHSHLNTWNQNIISRIKGIMFRIDLPRPIIQNPIPRCFVGIPPLKPSLLNRISLIDNTLIRPKFPIRDCEWKVDADLQETLWRIEKLGDLRYAFLLEYYLTQHLMEGTVTEEYYQSIKRLMLSYSFKKYLIEETGFFKHQKDSSLVNLQIKFRSKIAISQFHQYFSLLSPIDQSQWMNRMVEMLVKTANSLLTQECDQFFKELNHKMAKSPYSLDEMHKSRTIEIVKHSNILQIFNQTSLLSSKQAIEIGFYYLKYMVMKYNLNNHLSHFLDSNANFIDLVDTVYPKKELYEAIGHDMAARDIDYKITKVINTFYQKRHQAPFQTHQIPEISASMRPKPIGFKASFNLTLVKSLTLPKLSNHTDLSKLLMINYFHSRTFLEAIKCNLVSNRNRLPDIITMFGSMGNEYYTYLITRKVNEAGLDQTALASLKFWLLDKKFKLIVCEQSDFLVIPFSHENPGMEKKIHSICSKLFKENSRNEYFLLRYHNQIFNQYMGSLSCNEPELLHTWVSALVDNISQQLRNMPASEQRRTIARFEDSINEYRPYRHR